MAEIEKISVDSVVYDVSDANAVKNIQMNGSTLTKSSGTVNLGTVITDVSNKQDTLVSGTNIKTINNTSLLGSGNITVATDISGKADKVTSATNGNFAALNSSGNLTDSGKKDSDFVHKTGDETIAGNKSFNGTLGINGGVQMNGNTFEQVEATGFDWLQDENGDSVQDYLDNKQRKLYYYDSVIGTLYRENVSGSGNITITGTSGQFPTVTSAGTYTIETLMSSSTTNYTLTVSFGGVTDTYVTTNGTIKQAKTYTASANSTWSASISSGSVASGTILSVIIYSGAQKEVTSPIATVAITGSYNDLTDKPSGTFEVVSNKVTSLSSSSTDTQYPSAKCVYDIIGDVETLINAL